MRRQGRPPLDDNDPSVAISLRVPSKQYDALYERASRERVTVPELIRRALARECRDDQDDDE